MKSAQKYNGVTVQIFVYFLVVFILLLASVNINNFLTPKKVLGIKTEEKDTEKFWSEFTSQNPNYIPGWLEMKNINKGREIDPNFLTP